MTPQTKFAAVSAAVAALATPVVVHFEGEIRRGYRDPIGIVTACVGHTKTAQLGRAYTHAECLALLEHDLAEHNAGLLACVKVGMPPNVHAALLSWSFNVGVGAACESSAVRRLNRGDFAGACAELARWTMAGGKVMPGLVRRRAAERALCEGRPLSLGATG
jgi:lysozyme